MSSSQGAHHQSASRGKMKNLLSWNYHNMWPNLWSFVVFKFWRISVSRFIISNNVYQDFHSIRLCICGIFFKRFRVQLPAFRSLWVDFLAGFSAGVHRCYGSRVFFCRRTAICLCRRWCWWFGYAKCRWDQAGRSKLHFPILVAMLSAKSPSSRLLQRRLDNSTHPIFALLGERDGAAWKGRMP